MSAQDEIYIKKLKEEKEEAEVNTAELREMVQERNTRITALIRENTRLKEDVRRANNAVEVNIIERDEAKRKLHTLEERYLATLDRFDKMLTQIAEGNVKLAEKLKLLELRVKGVQDAKG